MTYIEIASIAIALSMDAFSVSVCKGLTLKQVNLKNALIVGAYFGIFQAIMPLTGYFLADIFTDKLQSFSDIIAFLLLAFVGVQMIYNNLKNEDEMEMLLYDNDRVSLGLKVMLPLAVATSIDALATGISFAMLSINILQASTFIGCTTFLISALGVKIGSFVGEKFSRYAEIIGGIVLILIGTRIVF